MSTCRMSSSLRFSTFCAKKSATTSSPLLVAKIQIVLVQSICKLPGRPVYVPGCS